MSYADSALKDFSAATLYEASGRQGMLDPSLRPVWHGARLFGPARCVRCKTGDNLALHRALAVADAGDVLVVTTGQDLHHGAWGEVMTEAARARGIAGLVTDGAVRDVEAIERLRFPVFAASIAVGGCDKHDSGTIDEPIDINGVPVRPGDIIVADADGVVAVTTDRAASVARAAEARETYERELIEKIRTGLTTYDLLGLAGR